MITNLGIGYSGRLGNQLFQYAACYSVAKRLNVDFVIPEKNINVIKQDGCFDFSNNQWISYNFRMYDCFELTAIKGDVNISKTFQEPYFHYCEDFNNIQNNTSVEGYYQSERYFIDYKENILNEFTFKPEIYNQALDIIKDFHYNEIVAVHIRRGDNVINPVFPVISIDYIQEALNEFTDKDYNFLIISDDINYCKEIFPESDNIKFSDGFSDFIDLCLMSLADHNIISNSSFSWWGAYLNKNFNKKVIAPSNWFKDKNINTKDLIPNNWKII
jgi:hypothetical protein